MITLDRILRETYTLARHDGTIVAAAVYLLPNGRIIGCESANEFSWSFNEGLLAFHDERSNVTTSFTSVSEIDDILIFSGPFLLQPEIHHTLKTRRGSVHGKLLNNAPPLSEQRPLLVLVRTHLVNDKLYRLLQQFKNANSLIDVAVIFDRSNGAPSAALGIDIIWHSIAECSAIGLTHQREQLLWWCGDFPLYFALLQRPQYQYYAMIEYDVHFTRDAGDFVERLYRAMRQGSGGSPIDAIGTRLREEDRNPEGIHGPIVRRFNPTFSYFFPLIVLSKRAVSFLYNTRQLEAARGVAGAGIAHCESFVPTLLAANGFRCVDLNDLLPGSYDNDLMILGNVGGLPVSQADGFERRVEFIHPVYGDEQYLTGNISRIGSADALKRFLQMLDSEAYRAIPEQIRAKCRLLAAARLARL